jgi:hypothetical protein
MNIDLSNKPDGATHYMSDEGRRNIWRMNNGAHWLAYVDGEWVLVVNATPERYIAIKAPWTGEGLPPVGTVCELWYSCGEWAPCMVMAHDISMGIPIAVVRHGDQCYTGSSAKTLRPIRTPEQIAAEEREKDVIAVLEVMKFAHWNIKNTEISPLGKCRIYAEAMVDAGYRKQVAQ